MPGRLEALERRLDHAAATAERLDSPMAELKRSFAKAQVLMGAAGEAKALVDGLRGAVAGR